MFDTRGNGNVNRGFGVFFEQTASVDLRSATIVDNRVPGGVDEDPPAPGPGTVRYLSKACRGEGRSYGKASAARSYTPTP